MYLQSIEVAYKLPMMYHIERLARIAECFYAGRAGLIKAAVLWYEPDCS